MICISICSDTKKRAFRDIRKAMSLCDLLELRMDRIRDGNLPELIRYIEEQVPDKPVLVTYRKTGEDALKRRRAAEKNGAGELAETERWEMLQEAVRLGVSYVDVEMDDEQDRIGELKTMIVQYGCRTRLVCSHHDFTGTPSLRTLKSVYRSCVEKGADVVKIVPFARCVEDNLMVLRFLAWAIKQGRDVVAFCMGEKGRISRIASPLFGALFTFAALDDRSAAAPGQLPARDMEKIFRILQVKGT